MYTLPSLGHVYSYWNCENGAMKWMKVRQKAENQRGMHFMSLKSTEFSQMLLGKATLMALIENEKTVGVPTYDLIMVE